MEGCGNIRDGPPSPPSSPLGHERHEEAAENGLWQRQRERKGKRERHRQRAREGWRILELVLKAQRGLKCHSVYTCLHVSPPYCVSVCVHIVCVSATSTHASTFVCVRFIASQEDPCWDDASAEKSKMRGCEKPLTRLQENVCESRAHLGSSTHK